MEGNDLQSTSIYPNSTRSLPAALRAFGALSKWSAGLTRNKDGTLNRRLADLLEPRVPANAKPVAGVSTKDVTLESESKIWARLFIPVSTESTDQHAAIKFPVVFYFHGGGFALLSPDFTLYDRFCRALARDSQVIVISVHYRRAPEYRFPVAYEDSFKALKWLRAKCPLYLPATTDLQNCFLMGDSAGGNIVHHLGVMAAEAAAELQPLSISGLLLLEPFFGGEERTPAELQLVNVPIISLEATDWYWKAFLPTGATRDHPACNPFGPGGKGLSDVDLPPCFVAVAEFDILRDRNFTYADELKKAGKQVQVKYYKNAAHVFHVFSRYAPAPLFLQDAKEFIRAHTKKK